jgi:hypothetical protein
MKGKILSDYDTKYSVFVYRENCETIYFVFHFIITQHIENRCDKYNNASSPRARLNRITNPTSLTTDVRTKG